MGGRRQGPRALVPHRAPRARGPWPAGGLSAAHGPPAALSRSRALALLCSCALALSCSRPVAPWPVGTPRASAPWPVGAPRAQPPQVPLPSTTTCAPISMEGCKGAPGGRVFVLGIPLRWHFSFGFLLRRSAAKKCYLVRNPGCVCVGNPIEVALFVRVFIKTIRGEKCYLVRNPGCVCVRNRYVAKMLVKRGS